MVDFTYNNGNVRRMQERYAKILERLKHGTYKRPILAGQAVKQVEAPKEDVVKQKANKTGKK